MRISKDDSSWRARGILRRDFRHSHDGPEVPVGGHRKRSKPRRAKVPRHKHQWVLNESYTPFVWGHSYHPPEHGLDYDSMPKRTTVYKCSHPQCRASKYVVNPRYDYEMYKWRRDNGFYYTTFK